MFIIMPADIVRQNRLPVASSFIVLMEQVGIKLMITV
jgi:hypothetical protein